MTYKQQVEAAAAALKRGDDANWELARLTHENTKTGRGDAKSDNKVSMSTWCADIAALSGRRFSTPTGEMYKRIWTRFGPCVGKDRPAWSDAYWQVRGGTAKEQFEKGGQRAIRNASPEVKRETFKALAEDEAIVDAVDRETGEVVASLIRKSSVAASHAAQALDERSASRPPREEKTTETARDEHKDALDLLAHLRTVHRKLSEVVGLAQNVRGVGADDLREAITHEIGWIRGACDVIEATVDGGSMDERLRDLLDSEVGR